MSRKNTIDFWRIIFTYMILIFHFETSFPYMKKMGLEPGWYIAVEFFFIVSGYLLYQKACGREGQMSPWRYTLHRYRQIYPRYLAAFFLTFAVILWIEQPGFDKGALKLLDSYWEILGLQGIGLDRGWDYINPVTWYISILFIAGFLLWFFLTRYREVFLTLIAPVTVMVCYSYLYREIGSLNAVMEVEGVFINAALMRGLADMCLGIFAARLNEKIRTKYSGKITAAWLQLLAGVGFVVVMILAAYQGHSTVDFLLALLLSLSVSLAFLPVENRFFTGSVVRKWSKITLNMYLLHEIFRTWLFPEWFSGKYSLGEKMLLMLLYLICVTLAAVLFELLFFGRKRKNA